MNTLRKPQLTLPIILLACAHGAPPSPRSTEWHQTAGPAVIAQACTPGMSCFGKVVLLPNGEVAEAAAAATATATANAMDKAKKDTDAKAKEKAAEKEKADAKTKMKEKEKVPCERRGGSVKKQSWMKLKCRYTCPGDPAGSFREVLLDAEECPPTLEFEL